MSKKAVNPPEDKKYLHVFFLNKWESILKQLKKILLERLEKKGIERPVIPAFMSNLASTIRVNPQTDLLHINKRLHLLGWDGFELDYHTLQLATAFLEAEGLKSLEFKTSAIA